MSISVVSVTKLYGPQKALDKVSFEIRAGEIVGFLGPNGAGKSTMMKIISGYIPMTEGSVKVCGMEVSEHEMAVKNKLGYLPENNPLYSEMYVKEYLRFIAGLYKMRKIKPRVDEIVDQVGLTKEQHKKIGALSKGYKQRVGLAQAFIHSPEVLILDEPTTGLDPNQIVEIRQLIREIGRNKTVMMSTHIMQEVEAICDRAIIINEGVVVADQEVKSLRNSLVGQNNLLVEFKNRPEQSLLEKYLSPAEFKIKEGNLIEFNSENLSAVKKCIMQFSSENDNEILNMSEGKGNLEEVFRKLTNKKLT